MMLLLQETLTIHLVFRATLSNLFHRFPLHFLTLAGFWCWFRLCQTNNLQITAFHYPILANRPVDFLSM
jgi:hypothetical protein